MRAVEKKVVDKDMVAQVMVAAEEWRRKRRRWRIVLVGTSLVWTVVLLGLPYAHLPDGNYIEYNKLKV